MNMMFNKDKHALTVKNFFSRNKSNALAAVRVYQQMTNLGKGSMSVNEALLHHI